MTKVFIATPAYDGKVDVQYAVALAETQACLLKNNIASMCRINAGGSLLVAERNRLIETFISTDCTHMLFVDSDLGWPPECVAEMLKKDVDFVAGCYPTRRDRSFIFRPCLNENGSIVTSEKALLKMEYIPAGFMLIKRSAIEKMRASFPELYFSPKVPKANDPFASGYLLFNTELFEGEFWGEDYVFCRRARKCGIDIWCDPMIQFNHAGQVGMLAECLSNKPPEQAPEQPVLTNA